MIWLWSALSLLMVVIIVRSVGVLSVGGVFAATCVLSQATILAVSSFDLAYLTDSSWISFRPVASLDAREAACELYFLVVAATCLAVTVPKLPSSTRMVTQLKTSFGDKQTNLFRTIIWISFAVNLVHFVLIDRDKLWSAAGYQVMKNPEQMGFSAALLPLFLLPRFTGFVAITGLVVFLRKKDLIASAASIVAFAYSFLLSLAQNSRLASLYILAALAANALIGRRLVTIVNAALLCFSMVTAIAVLKGRHDPTQGVGQAVSQLFSFDVEGADFLGLFLNLNASGLITADSIVTNANYPDRYKELSFSPFPSVVDGFSDIREQEERRVNYFTPINAFGEVYLFGSEYIAIFLASIYVWVRSSAVASRKLGPRFSAVITLLGILSAVTLQQYSLRTGYRFILVSIAVCLVAIWISKRPSRRITPPMLASSNQASSMMRRERIKLSRGHED